MTDVQDVGVSQDQQNILLSDGTNQSDSGIQTATSDTLGGDDNNIGIHKQLTSEKIGKGIVCISYHLYYSCMCAFSSNFTLL